MTVAACRTFYTLPSEMVVTKGIIDWLDFFLIQQDKTLMTRLNQRLNLISRTLLAKGETLAVAESVTAGLLMSRLSLAKDATQFFQGGITAYNLGQKAKHLSVDPILADKANCVSADISLQMARDVALKFNSHWGLAVTGYAVPVPALKIKTCYAFCSIVNSEAKQYSFRIETNFKEQLKNQTYYVDQILKEFLSQMQT